MSQSPFQRLRQRFRPTEVPVVHEESERPVAQDKEAGAMQEKQVRVDTDTETEVDEISVNAQRGVQKMEATTKAWTKKWLIFAYVWIWIIYFVDTMQQGMSNSLAPYVTSDFQAHSLTAATSIMSSLIGGIWKLPLAKLLDIWGRPHGFAISVFFLTIGLLMMAACQNVETYAAAQVFYWVGYNGLDYSITVFIADTSALKNRALMFAFVSSPYIITTWVGGPLAESFLGGAGFRWGFGVLTIVTPIVCAPLLFVFVHNYRKAVKAGLMPANENQFTFTQAVKHYAIEFDVVGILLISAGLALFLLPFNLYSYQADGWHSAMVIAMIIVGALLLVAFALYEKYVAPVTFIPYHLLTDRTVISSCILAAALFVSFYIWDSYFSSFLQVVQNVSIRDASYIGNVYSIGSCFWSIIVGIAVRWSGRFRWIALYFGVPITILGVGLMIAFRQPDVNIGYVVMCQIFIAVGGGALVITEQMAVMASTSHQYIAVVLAVQAMFSSIGGAIGSTVASAIWTGVFPQRLAEYLPAESQGNLTTIYESLVEQQAYPVGSPTRDAINHAYGDAQKYMLIAATAVQIISVVAVLMWRDIKVKDFKQVKGLVV